MFSPEGNYEDLMVAALEPGAQNQNQRNLRANHNPNRVVPMKLLQAALPATGIHKEGSGFLFPTTWQDFKNQPL